MKVNKQIVSKNRKRITTAICRSLAKESVVAYYDRDGLFFDLIKSLNLEEEDYLELSVTFEAMMELENIISIAIKHRKVKK